MDICTHKEMGLMSLIPCVMQKPLNDIHAPHEFMFLCSLGVHNCVCVCCGVIMGSSLIQLEVHQCDGRQTLF